MHKMYTRHRYCKCTVYSVHCTTLHLSTDSNNRWQFSLIQHAQVTSKKKGKINLKFTAVAIVVLRVDWSDHCYCRTHLKFILEHFPFFISSEIPFEYHAQMCLCAPARTHTLGRAGLGRVRCGVWRNIEYFMIYFENYTFTIWLHFRTEWRTRLVVTLAFVSEAETEGWAMGDGGWHSVPLCRSFSAFERRFTIGMMSIWLRLGTNFKIDFSDLGTS